MKKLDERGNRVRALVALLFIPSGIVWDICIEPFVGLPAGPASTLRFIAYVISYSASFALSLSASARSRRLNDQKLARQKLARQRQESRRRINQKQADQKQADQKQVK